MSDIDSTDVSVINNKLHPANLTGTFCCEALGGTFIVHRGTFQLFSQDPRQPETANLVYDFDMVSPKGKKLHFNGYKVVNAASFLNPFSVWRQTTTLYVTVTDGGEVVGRGTLSTQPLDFYREVQTFESNGPTVWTRLTAVTSFVTYFARQLAIPFFSTLGRLQWPSDGINDSFNMTTPSQIITLQATDGVQTTMLMWEPTAGSKLDAPSILFVPGAAVDHTIFALPTIEKNTINYFREAGYRTYCVTTRFGRIPLAREGYTAYDARRDVHAALVHIRKIEGALNVERQKPYVVAHCVGSLAFCCGLLDGTIPAEWISGITASAVFMNPRFGKANYFTARVGLDKIYSKLVGDFWDCTSSREDGYVQQLFNQLLRLYPVGDARETCRSVVCHRSELVFGR